MNIHKCEYKLQDGDGRCGNMIPSANYEQCSYRARLELDAADALEDRGHHDLAQMARDRAASWQQDRQRIRAQV